jgi:RNA polymerase sigma-70 factor (sigma-E family)
LPPPSDGPDLLDWTASPDKDAAFTAAVSRRQAAWLRIAYLLSGDAQEAEDVLQTSLCRLYLSWEKLRDPNALDAYMRRIIVNETNSLWRRAWKRREVSSELPDVTTGYTDTYDFSLLDPVWRLVSSLPARARAVVVLRYYEDLSDADIAETLGISVGTVKSQASRALARMRAHLNDAATEGACRA